MSGNGPSIPLRTSARTSLSSPKERKRRSLPVSPQKENRHSSNHVHVKPASTEVISSLIDTLSAISSPVEQHFEQSFDRFDSFPDISASVSTPVSPSPWHTGFSAAGRTASNRNSYLLRPEHPTIRDLSSARRPSDRSLNRSSRIYNGKGSEDEYSIGNVSVEPQPWQSSTSLASLGGSEKARSLRSIRSFKNLGLKRSKDSFHFPSVPRPREQKCDMPHQERLVIPNSRSPSPPLDRLEIPKRNARAEKHESLFNPGRASTAHELETPKRLFLYGDFSSDEPSTSKRSSYNFPNHDLIPQRNSSIRHNRVSTSDRKRRSRSAQPEDGDLGEADIQQSEEVDNPDISVLSDVASFKTAPATPVETPGEYLEDTVLRRIRQLKEQKDERLRMSLGDAPEGLAPPRIHTRTPSPMASPAPVSKVSKMPDAETTKTLIDTPKVNGDAPAFLAQEPPAPPPTVRTAPVRSDQDNVPTLPGNSTATRPAMPRTRPSTPGDDARSVSLTSPQRRHSKLQKRMSTSGATSPTSEQRHRRRFSTPVPPIVRMSTYQSDGGDSIDNAVERYLLAPRLSQKVKTQTGRVVSFSEVGDPNGSVVFCCVGMGLTRYLTAFYDELAASLSLRLITPDRPGVGGSEPHADGNDTPLGWPDDVRSICEQLRITKFSVLAHSAGAIYALATALRMPQHIRCRVHLLAPWIPPSQMSASGTQQEPLPANALPYSQRFLRSLPTPFLRAANSSFLNFTSNSITTSLPRTPKQRPKHKNASRSNTPGTIAAEETPTRVLAAANVHNPDPASSKEDKPPLTHRGASAFDNIATDSRPNLRAPTTMDQLLASSAQKEKDPDYKNRLTSAIWDAATTNANAAVDLIVCLERKQPIGFRYVDITRTVVIHHGSKDSRVPVENVKWLGNMMRRCEVRVLEGEGHGLMASALVMGNVLEEMSGEWDDWLKVTRGRRGPVSP